MIKHTPGPWMVYEKGQIIGSRNGRICNLIYKMEHNAELIAAAPQMLEALEKIAEIGRQKGDARPQDAVSCFVIAEAAIAAANGNYDKEQKITTEEKLQQATKLTDKYIEMLGRNCQTCRFGCRLICYCGERIRTKAPCNKGNNYKYYERDRIDE